MNKYIYPLCDTVNSEINLITLHALSLKDAIAKVSIKLNLSKICETNLELDQTVYDETEYLIGEIINIDEL